MDIERSHVEQILRERGSIRTAEAVEEQLPEQIDTERDRELIKQCGIDPNVLESIATQASAS